MPARARMIGPEVSERIGRHIEDARTANQWTRADLAAYMEGQGFKMSPATIYQIEQGIIQGKGEERRVRLITVDEFAAFIEVLMIPPVDAIRWLLVP